MSAVAEDKHKKAAGMARELLATYKNSEDLINLGAYARGSNKKIDIAINYHENIVNYLKQGIDEKSQFKDSIAALEGMFN